MTTSVLGGREPWTRMVVAVSGSSGLIGSALTRALAERGHEVRALVRRAPRGPQEIAWDPASGTIDAEQLAKVDAIVHLAGENIAQRWTDDARRRILDSRVKSTTLLARTITASPRKPLVLLSGSAVGYYGAHRGDEVLDESSTPGNDFLADVCKAWEAAAAPVRDTAVRTVFLRTGIVLAREGGALAKMLLPFRFGVGGKLGDGRQWMSWISRGDYVRAVIALLAGETDGPVNMVSPNPVSNREFAQTLGRVLGRPSLFPVPKLALELALGRMADDTVLASQRVVPRRLLAMRFEYQHPTLEGALRAELAS